MGFNNERDILVVERRLRTPLREQIGTQPSLQGLAHTDGYHIECAKNNSCAASRQSRDARGANSASVVQVTHGRIGPMDLVHLISFTFLLTSAPVEPTNSRLYGYTHDMTCLLIIKKRTTLKFEKIKDTAFFTFIVQLKLKTD